MIDLARTLINWANKMKFTLFKTLVLISLISIFSSAYAGTYEIKEIPHGSWELVIPAATATEKVLFTHGDVWCVSLPAEPTGNPNTYFKYEVNTYGKDRDINRTYIDALYCTKATSGGKAYARIKTK